MIFFFFQQTSISRSTTTVAVLVILSYATAQQGQAYDTNDWIPITPKTQPQSRSLVANDNVAESSKDSNAAVPPESDKDPPPLPQRASSRVLNLDAPQAQKFFPDDEHRAYRKRRPHKHKNRGEDGYKFELPPQLPKGSSLLQYTNQDLNPAIYEQPPPLDQYGIQRQPVYSGQSQLPPQSVLSQPLPPRLASQQAVASNQVVVPQRQILTPQHQVIAQQQPLASQQSVPHQQQSHILNQQQQIAQVGHDQRLSAQHRIPQQEKVSQQIRVPQNEQVYLQQQQLPPINAPNTYQQYNLPFNNTFYESLNPGSINHELLSVGQNQQAPSKTPANGGKDTVQLVYVPLENLETNQQQKELTSEAEIRQAELKNQFNTRLTNIEQDFVHQALQAQRLQDQITLGQPLFYKQQQQFLQPQQKPQQYKIVQHQQPHYAPPQENVIQSKPQQYEQQQQLQYTQPQENSVLPQPQRLVQLQHSAVTQQQPQQYVTSQQHEAPQQQYLTQPQLFVTPQHQPVTPQKHFIQSEQRQVQAQPLVRGQKSNVVQSQRHLVQKATEQQQIPHAQASNVPPSTATSPGNNTPKKRKPHQPPLAVYLETNKNADLDDVLDALKEAKTIAVQDSIQPESPQVFIGPSSLNPPDGYVKFLLPYLNALDGKRDKNVEELPFFVAPLSFKAPPGFSKIPLPSPHVGSVVVNNKELSTRRPSSTPSYYGETGNNYVTVGSSYGTSHYSPNIQSYNSENFYQTPSLGTSHQLDFHVNNHTQKLEVPAMQTQDVRGPTTPLTGEVAPTAARHKERVRIKNFKHTSNTNTGEAQRNAPKIKSNSNFEQTFTVKEYSKPLKSHLQDSYFKKGEEKFPSLISNNYGTPSKNYVNTPSSLLSGTTTDSHVFSFTPKPEKTEAEKVIDELHSHSHSHAPKKEEPQLKPLHLATDNFDLHQINTHPNDKHRSKDQVHYSPEDGFSYHHRKPEKPDSTYSFNSDLHSFKPSTILRDVNVETTTQKSKSRRPTTVPTGSREHYTVLEDFSATESSKYGSPYDEKTTTSKYDTVGEGNSNPYDHFDYENTKGANKHESFGDFRPSYEEHTNHAHEEPPNPYFEQAQENVYQDYNNNHKQQHSQHNFPEPNLDDISDTFVSNPYLKSFKPSKGSQNNNQEGGDYHRQSTVSGSGEDHFRQDHPKDEKKEKEYDASLADQSVTSLLTPNLLLPSKKKQNQNTKNEYSNPYFDFSSVAADGPQIDTSLYDYVPTTNLEPQGFGPSANSQLYTPESGVHQPSTTAQTKPAVTRSEAPEVVYIHPTTTTTTTTTTEKPTTTTKPEQEVGREVPVGSPIP
nr:unnamed protein product [Callosobruchus chinensis]